MLFSLFEILLLLGVFQGVITAIILASKSASSSHANRLLALFLFFFSAICLKAVIYSAGLESRFTWLAFIPLAFETALPALAYLICIALTEPSFKTSRSQLIHAIPFTFFMLFNSFIYVSLLFIDSPAAKELFLAQHHFKFVKDIEDYVTVMLIIFYLLISVNKIQQFRYRIDNLTSDNGHSIFLWLRRLQMLMLLLLTFLVTNMLLDKLFELSPAINLHWQLYFLYLAGTIYYLGFKAIHVSFKFEPSTVNLLTPLSVVPPTEVKKQKILAEQICSLLDEEQLYLDAQLSVQVLVDKLGENANTISQAINRQLNVSFRELINQKRIEFAKQQLLNNHDAVSILSIAMDAGFNSEASFYRIFKKHLGITPTQFINNNKSSH